MELNSLFAPLFILWALALLLLLFRRGLETIWKLCALLVFAFYALWFRGNISASCMMYSQNFAKTAVILLSVLGDAATLCLLILWPFVVFRAFFVGAGSVSSGLVRILVLLTVFYWIFWFLDYFTPPFLEGLLVYIVGKLESVFRIVSSPPTP